MAPRVAASCSPYMTPAPTASRVHSTTGAVRLASNLPLPATSNANTAAAAVAIRIACQLGSGCLPCRGLATVRNTTSAAMRMVGPAISCQRGLWSLDRAEMTNATSSDATSTGSTVLTGPNCKATELDVCPIVIATMPSHHNPLLTNSISTVHDSSPPDVE